MTRSLSWFDPQDLASALVRAGLAGDDPRQAPRALEPRPKPLAARGREDEPAALLPRPATELRSHQPLGELERTLNQSSLQERLKALLVWVMEQTGCRRLFVIDGEGLVLIERAADPTLVAISSACINLLARLHVSLGAPTRASLAIELDQGQTLHLVQAETDLGRYALGLMVPQPLRPEQTDSFRRGLVLAMSEIEDADEAGAAEN